MALRPSAADQHWLIEVKRRVAQLDAERPLKGRWRRLGRLRGVVRSILHGTRGNSAWALSMARKQGGQARARRDLEGLRRIGREAAAMRKRRAEYERQRKQVDSS